MGKPPKINTKKAWKKSAPHSGSATPTFHDEPIEPLSGKPFCVFIISPDFKMDFPKELNSELPNRSVPAEISYGKRTWITTLHGDKKPKCLENKTWKRFFDSNKLRNGDGLILEVMHKSNYFVQFKAQILRGELPADLRKKLGGDTPETAISID